ncbi:MAG: hypothetical protein HY754_14020 [Nitrospirae bacterium]|nr:hypothetical protein [Nitrospirota bacterium]
MGKALRKNLFRNPIFHLFLIAIVGLLAYSNTFNVPFQFDDDNIIGNNKLRHLNNFWPPTGSRWFGFLTFAFNYHLGGHNVTGYHIFNLTIHTLNAILVYWLVKLTLTIHDAGYTIHVTEKMQDAGYRIQDKNHESCIMNLESSSIACTPKVCISCSILLSTVACDVYKVQDTRYKKDARCRIHDTR